MRLIDADALRKKARYAFKSNTGGHIPPVVSTDDIDDAPTIVAEPVRHGKILTIEELREMHGEPVWIEQENAWGIVIVDKCGQWKNKPFVSFYYESVRCDWDIEKRGLTCYRHKLEKHGRWIWKDFHGDGSLTLCCSECLETEGARATSKYCHECGARMDVEDNDV